MKTFLTSYSAGGHHYGAYLQAQTFAEARAVAGRRGLNEIIEGEIGSPAIPHALAMLIREERWTEAAHEACFLGFLGLVSGSLHPRELLADNGLIHQLLHLATARPDHPDEAPEIAAENNADRAHTIAEVVSMARDFEYRIPGHLPTFEPAHVERGRLEQEAEAAAPTYGLVSKAEAAARA